MEARLRLHHTLVFFRCFRLAGTRLLFPLLWTVSSSLEASPAGHARHTHMYINPRFYFNIVVINRGRPSYPAMGRG